MGVMVMYVQTFGHTGYHINILLRFRYSTPVTHYVRTKKQDFLLLLFPVFAGLVWYHNNA